MRPSASAAAACSRSRAACRRASIMFWCAVCASGAGRGASACGQEGSTRQRARRCCCVGTPAAGKGTGLRCGASRLSRLQNAGAGQTALWRRGKRAARVFLRLDRGTEPRANDQASRASLAPGAAPQPAGDDGVAPARAATARPAGRRRRDGRRGRKPSLGNDVARRARAAWRRAGLPRARPAAQEGQPACGRARSHAPAISCSWRPSFAFAGG